MHAIVAAKKAAADPTCLQVRARLGVAHQTPAGMVVCLQPNACPRNPFCVAVLISSLDPARRAPRSPRSPRSSCSPRSHRRTQDMLDMHLKSKLVNIIDSANASGDKEIAELSAELVTLSANSVLDSFDNLLAAGKDDEIIEAITTLGKINANGMLGAMELISARPDGEAIKAKLLSMKAADGSPELLMLLVLDDARKKSEEEKATATATAKSTAERAGYMLSTFAQELPKCDNLQITSNSSIKHIINSAECDAAESHKYMQTCFRAATKATDKAGTKTTVAEEVVALVHLKTERANTANANASAEEQAEQDTMNKAQNPKMQLNSPQKAEQEKAEVEQDAMAKKNKKVGSRLRKEVVEMGACHCAAPLILPAPLVTSAPTACRCCCGAFVGVECQRRRLLLHHCDAAHHHRKHARIFAW